MQLTESSIMAQVLNNEIEDETQALTSVLRTGNSPTMLSFSVRNCKGNQAAFMILFFTMLVGITHGIFMYLPIELGLMKRDRDQKIPFHVLISWTLAGYGFLGVVQMLYPIGGLIADIRCGRYKIITLSLLSLWVGFFLASFIGVSYAITIDQHTYKLDVAHLVIGVLAFIAFTAGFGGYQSNAVQFGLDQLLDASSEELSLFLHWFVWTGYIGELVLNLLSTASTCNKVGIKIGCYIALLFLVLSTICILLVWFKRRWFNCEKKFVNPYKNVYRVLKFTVRHGKPLGHRSALTYSDDVRPSKIDFAKQKYGGIFTTEVVEDVKTFIRILLMLLAITPMFYFEVSTSYLFPIYGLHLGINVSVNDKCTYEWMVFESGNLTSIISTVAIPLYIILVYPHIKRWVPRIIYRMGIGITMKVTVLIIMFIIQVVANYNSSQNTCIFLSEYRINQHYALSPTLEFPTQVLVIISILNGVASPLINITVLEFISAQSPHTMKGLLLGVFYALRGLFITLGCILTLVFAQEKLWGDHRGIFDCGFYYYLSNSVLGVIGLVVFLMAARQYRNRERDDPPYTHQYAEDYYSRYASRPTTRLVEEEVETYGSIK